MGKAKRAHQLQVAELMMGTLRFAHPTAEGKAQ